MSAPFPFQLADSPTVLASCQGWTEEVYRDLFAFQAGRMSATDLDAKYVHRKAILTLDLTGFTEHCMHHHPAHAFLRILDAQRICVPVFQEYGASLIHAFADDLVGLFDEPARALDAAFEMHRRVAAFNASGLCGPHPAECCVGVGFGDVYAIGMNRAMGDEMNRAAKLGEEIALGGETLVTSNLHAALRHNDDFQFDPQQTDDQRFPYFRASPSRRA
jgi:class 3 adenylate cyclase